MIAQGFHEEIIIAGFGGQGVVMLGKLLAYAGMDAGREVTFMPAYGPEVRGGTANGMVVLATDPIACPIVTHPDTLIMMNEASLNRFLSQLKPGGLLVYNSSMIEAPIERDDIDILPVPADEIALELDSPRSANMAALGAYLQKREILDVEQVAGCLKNVFPPHHHKTIPVNTQAMRQGAASILQA